MDNGLKWKRDLGLSESEGKETKEYVMERCYKSCDREKEGCLEGCTGN